MPVYRGTYFVKNITLRDKVSSNPIDITGWKFRAQFRDDRGDSEVLLELTTDGGGLVVANGSAGVLSLRIQSDQTLLFPEAKIVFDVVRTDVDPGPTYQFGGRFKVKTPVTRDD